MTDRTPGVALEFAGHAMRRWRHSAEQDLIAHIAAFETAYRATAHLLATWPGVVTITSEADIPVEERDAVWAVVGKASDTVGEYQALMRSVYQAQQHLLAAVRAVPVRWDAAETRQLMRQPHLYGLTTEDTEDLACARERGTPWPTPTSEATL